MSDKPSPAPAYERLSAYLDWAWKFAVAAGVIAILYLNQHYVQADKYDADRAASDATARVQYDRTSVRLEVVERACCKR